MGSKMHIRRLIAIWISKLWFGSPCICGGGKFGAEFEKGNLLFYNKPSFWEHPQQKIKFDEILWFLVDIICGGGKFGAEFEKGNLLFYNKPTFWKYP